MFVIMDYLKVPVPFFHMSPFFTNNMKNYFLILVVLGLLSGCCGGGGPESPAAKHENSVLEAVCAQHENSPIQEIEFVESEGYRLVCLPSNARRIWIILNPKTEPYYKQMPKGQYSVTKADIDLIAKSGYASYTVLACIESHYSKE
jgi:hypothetical protein